MFGVKGFKLPNFSQDERAFGVLGVLEPNAPPSSSVYKGKDCIRVLLYFLLYHFGPDYRNRRSAHGVLSDDRL